VAAGRVRDNGEKLFPPAQQVDGWVRTVVESTIDLCFNARPHPGLLPQEKELPDMLPVA